MGRLTHYQGQFRRTAVNAERHLQIARQREDLVQQGMALTSMMEGKAQTADGGDLLGMSGEVMRLAEQSGEFGSKVKALGGIALAHLWSEDWQAAEENARSVLALIAKGRPTSFGLLGGYNAPAQVYLTLWERGTHPDSGYLKRQTALAVKALATFAKIFPVGEPAALRARGTQAWLSGRTVAAQQLWHKSLERARAMHMPFEEALTLYDLARRLPADDPQRAEYLARVKSVFEQAEAGPHLRRAKEDLG
jgi:hypothetical protein